MGIEDELRALIEVVEELKADMADMREAVLDLRTQKQTYTVGEVADVLGVGKNTVYRLISDGRLPNVNLYGASERYLVSRTGLQAFLNGGGLDCDEVQQ